VSCLRCTCSGWSVARLQQTWGRPRLPLLGCENATVGASAAEGTLACFCTKSAASIILWAQRFIDSALCACRGRWCGWCGGRRSCCGSWWLQHGPWGRRASLRSSRTASPASSGTSSSPPRCIFSLRNQRVHRHVPHCQRSPAATDRSCNLKVHITLGLCKVRTEIKVRLTNHVQRCKQMSSNFAQMLWCAHPWRHCIY
jgi:hypothetical protein